jgi:hypothetical protein
MAGQKRNNEHLDANKTAVPVRSSEPVRIIEAQHLADRRHPGRNGSPALSGLSQSGVGVPELDRGVGRLRDAH